MSEDEEEILHGGMTNVGAVVRRGDTVERPALPHAPVLHAHLRALAAAGFDGAPTPLGTSEDGLRERLSYLPGDVPLPPFPSWALTDEALHSVAVLLRRLHRASASLPVDRTVRWPAELADPEADPEAGSEPDTALILCHNDICPENVVFREGRAAAFIDFDLTAPGRPLWDVATTARYWVRLSGEDPGAAHRLRVLADGYGLTAEERAGLVPAIEQAAAAARAFTERRVRDGSPVHVRALADRGGWERWDRHQAWLAANRAVLTERLLREQR
ncbi:phosphotransferase enzyme family protein [Streptomyces sp. NPDC102451]|uniref:phosphotransferase enzyme family protein n=1 Tax=Streptomyces sp. NPDC102451 TaxID=3366177 RepID=UPI00381AE465